MTELLSPFAAGLTPTQWHAANEARAKRIAAEAAAYAVKRDATDTDIDAEAKRSPALRLEQQHTSRRVPRHPARR